MSDLRQCTHGFHHPLPGETNYPHSCDGCWCEGERDRRLYGWPHTTEPPNHPHQQASTDVLEKKMTDNALARDLTHALDHHGYNTHTEVVEDVRRIVDAHQAAYEAVIAPQGHRMTSLTGVENLIREAGDYLAGDQHRPTRMVRKLRDALASAEAAIRDAPHESWCASNDWGDDNEPADARPCDCWKSEVSA